MNKENKLEFFIPKKENGLGQWLAEEGISAGFLLLQMTLKKLE